jgi:hypothetical protein
MKLLKQFHSTRADYTPLKWGVNERAASAPFTWLKPGVNESATNQAACKNNGFDFINTRLQSGVSNAGCGNCFNSFWIENLK